MDIDDSEVIVITVLMFKAKDMVPFHKFNIDHILTKDTLHLNTFKKIVWTEGIETDPFHTVGLGKMIFSK